MLQNPIGMLLCKGFIIGNGFGWGGGNDLGLLSQNGISWEFQLVRCRYSFGLFIKLKWDFKTGYQVIYSLVRNILLIKYSLETDSTKPNIYSDLPGVSV